MKSFEERLSVDLEKISREVKLEFQSRAVKLKALDAAILRLQGKTFKEIAGELGLRSATKASALVHLADRLLRFRHRVIPPDFPHVGEWHKLKAKSHG